MSKEISGIKLANSLIKGGFILILAGGVGGILLSLFTGQTPIGAIFPIFIGIFITVFTLVYAAIREFIDSDRGKS